MNMLNFYNPNPRRINVLNLGNRIFCCCCKYGFLCYQRLRVGHKIHFPTLKLLLRKAIIQLGQTFGFGVIWSGPEEIFEKARIKFVIN